MASAPSSRDQDWKSFESRKLDQFFEKRPKVWESVKDLSHEEIFGLNEQQLQKACKNDFVGSAIYNAIHPSESGGGQGAGAEELQTSSRIHNGIVVVEVTTLALPTNFEEVQKPSSAAHRAARKHLFIKLLALETVCSALFKAYKNQKVVQFAMLDSKSFQTLKDGVPETFLQFFEKFFAAELPLKIKQSEPSSIQDDKRKNDDAADTGGEQKPGHIFEASVVASFRDYLVGFLRAVKKSTSKFDSESVIVSPSRRIDFPTIQFTEECCAVAREWGVALPETQVEIDIYAKAYLPEWGSVTISPSNSPNVALGAFVSGHRTMSPLQISEQKDKTSEFLPLETTPRVKIRAGTYAAVFPFLFDLFLDRHFLPVSRAEHRSWGNWGGLLVERLAANKSSVP